MLILKVISLPYSRGLTLSLLWIILTATSPSSPVVAQDFLRTVALTGQPTPGTIASHTFERFESPSINESGHVAFSASRLGGLNDGLPHDGVWSEGGGALRLVALVGEDAAGDTDGAVYNRLFRPNINELGHTAFYGRVSDQSAGDEFEYGLWIEGASGLELIARTGSPANGTADATFLNFNLSNPILSNSGKTAFVASLNHHETGHGTGVWMGDRDSLHLMALTGEATPGLPGVEYPSFSLGSSVLLNDAGIAVFADDSSGFLQSGVWRSNGTTAAQPIARFGDPQPDLPGYFVNFGEPSLNSAGQSLFLGMSYPVGSDAITGLWLADGDRLESLVSDSDSAPDTADGVTFDLTEQLLSRNPKTESVLSDTGRFAFRSYLSGSENPRKDVGLWAGDRDEIRLVAKHGDQAPGGPAGVAFDRFFYFSVNAAGQTAFSASLTDSTVGIWAESRSGELILLALSGTELDLSDAPKTTDMREVQHLEFLGKSGNGDGLASAFNNRGQLAFTANFTDGTSGVFVSSKVAIPEPWGFATLLVGITSLVTHMRSDRRLPTRTSS